MNRQANKRETKQAGSIVRVNLCLLREHYDHIQRFLSWFRPGENVGRYLREVTEACFGPGGDLRLADGKAVFTKANPSEKAGMTLKQKELCA